MTKICVVLIISGILIDMYKCQDYYFFSEVMVKCATPLKRKGLGQSSKAERILALSMVDDDLIYTKRGGNPKRSIIQVYPNLPHPPRDFMYGLKNYTAVSRHS